MSVSLSASSLVVGQTAQATAVVKDAEGNTLNRQVSWSTSNPAQVSVSASGLVSALSPGSATITATTEGQTGTASVVIALLPVSEVSVTLTSASLSVGATAQAVATLKDANGNVITGRSVDWSSSSSAVATVSATGLVTAIGAGTSTIAATSEGKTGTAVVTVSVAPVASVTVGLAASSLYVGATTQASATLKDASNNVLIGRSVAWSTSNAAVATVGPSGIVTSVGVGTCSITATSEGQSGSAALTVSSVPVASVAVSLASSSITVGATTQATATLRDANSNVLTGRPIAWSSGTSSVASVSSDGVVTALAAGTSTITATSEGKTGSATVTVALAPVATITVSIASPSLTVGGTTQATAILKDANNNVLTGRSIVWTSGTTGVASINSAGVVTALAAGTSTITATSEGKSGSASVTVSVVPVASVAVSLASSSLTVGATTQATAVLKDANNNVLTGRSVVWSTSAAAVATVNSAGVVTAVGTGNCNITATSEGKSGSDAVSVALVPVASVSVTLASGSILVGATTQATAVLKDANNNVLTGRSIVWTSGNTGAASVSSSGLVTAIAAGTSAITATSEGKSGSATVTVSSSTPPPSGRWVSGYWVGYQRDLYPENQVDFSLMTHILVGAIDPTPSGGVTTDFFLDPVTGPQVAKTLSSRAHLAGRKAILMLGGAGQLSNMLSATSSTTINTFVANLITTMDDLGYDGIDVDWEPLNDVDKPRIITFLQKLRAARPGMILTFPIGWVNANGSADPWYAQVAPLVDQLNVMSYEMAGNWGGWVSWHEAALYGEGGDHPSSISSTVTLYKAAGVPAAKLGIGLGFYGSCWHGTTAPLQPLGASAGVYASDNTMSYTNIMADYYNSSAYRWDATARMGYLTFASPTGSSQCSFVSYEDEQSIAEKGAYVKSSGIGGTIIWTINQGRLPNAPAGSQDPLLKAAYNSIVP